MPREDGSQIRGGTARGEGKRREGERLPIHLAMGGREEGRAKSTGGFFHKKREKRKSREDG